MVVKMYKGDEECTKEFVFKTGPFIFAAESSFANKGLESSF